MSEAIRKYRLMRESHVRRFFARAVFDMLYAKFRRLETASGEFTDPRWPSHLHINVVPQARGTGAAEALMVQWFAKLEEAGSRGCHLQTLVENERAVRFFDRMGFRAHGNTPLVPGIRHEGGRLHQLTMVRDGAR